MTVADAFRELARHPVQHLIRHWNWKAAVLSAGLRGAIFFSTNLTAGWPAALRALGVDVPLRLGLAGLYGAVMQVFRRAEPVWASSMIMVTLLVGTTHAMEFVVHSMGGTPELARSITYSMIFSAVSVLVNLFLMRRGALLVGAGSATLRQDLRRIPGLLVELVRRRHQGDARGGAPGRSARDARSHRAEQESDGDRTAAYDAPHHERVSRDLRRHPDLLSRRNGDGEP